MSAETAIYTVLAAAIAAAEEGDALFAAELHNTLYEQISGTFGVRVGDASFDLSPGPGGPVEEFDVLGMVEIFAFIIGEDKTAAREKVRAIGLAVAQVFIDDPTLGGAINDCRVLGGQRGWAKVHTNASAVAHLHVIANETGGYGQ